MSAITAAEPRRTLPWTQIRLALVALYGAGYVWWFFARGVIIDRISVLLSVALFLVVASVGRPPMQWLRMAGDLTLFVAMWIAYDESRGIADRLGFPIQVESVRDMDRALFFGADPVVWLQDRFLRSPGNVQWYDVVGSMVYYSHFIVPPVTIAVLWFVSRRQWVRYMRRFATLLFVSCTLFILVPTAPPWMAAGGRNSLGLRLDALPPLRRTTGAGWRHIGLDGFVKAWDTGRDWANQVAAMPSLHSAFALFVVVFFYPWIRSWPLRLAMLLYPLTMAVALMYFAEHYFVDALAGWVIVGATFWMWNRIERRLDARRLDAGADSELDSDPDRTDIDGELGGTPGDDRAAPVGHGGLDAGTTGDSGDRLTSSPV